MRTEVTITAETGAEVLTATQAKQYLKQDYGIIAAEDAIIERQIKAARQLCERYIDSTIVTKSLTCQVSDLYDWDYEDNGTLMVKVPRGPVTAISAVARIVPGVANAALTLDSDYYVLGQSFKRVVINSAATVTTSGLYQTDGYLITYTAGMTSPESPLIEGILKTVADLYENRGNEIPDAGVRLTYDAKTLWNPYRQTINI